MIIKCALCQQNRHEVRMPGGCIYCAACLKGIEQRRIEVAAKRKEKSRAKSWTIGMLDVPERQAHKLHRQLARKSIGD